MNKLIQGDCLEELKKLEDNSVDSIVSDPPYGISFMGKKWDYNIPSVEVWQECLRVLKPGGHALIACGTRTQHRMAVNLEDAGFEIRDVVSWIYGCLSEDTEILTINGWKKYNDIKIGDIVFACDYTNNLDLVAEEVNDVFLYEYNEDAYYIKDTGYYSENLMTTDHIVSKNHNVLVNDNWAVNSDGFGKIQAEELYKIVNKRKSEKINSVFHIPGLKNSIPCLIEKKNYKGKVWCISVESGAFVARRNGKIFITGNSGFPKSHNIGKAVDKLRKGSDKLDEFSLFIKKKREELGISKSEADKFVCGGTTMYSFFEGRKDKPLYFPNKEHYKKIKELLKLDNTWDDFVLETNEQIVGYENGDFGFQKGGQRWNGDKKILELTDKAKKYEGQGTALKPAMELWTLCRKPLSEKTIAKNVLKWGTGGINIDGCRVGSEKHSYSINGATKGGNFGNGANQPANERNHKTVQGRFPANLIHDGSEEVVSEFPDSKSSNAVRKNNKTPLEPKDGWNANNMKGQDSYGFDDSGSASRFFYCAKSSKAERNKGLEGFEEKERIDYGGFHSEKGLIENGRNPENRVLMKNNHPTVKPIKLMKYLCRLITPKDGTVIDPYMGSGTTGIACKEEDFGFIGIEKDEEYFKIAKARINS